MPIADPYNSIEATRARWTELDGPRPVPFTALMSLLRTSVMVTEQMDATLRRHGLPRTSYLLLLTLMLAPGSTRPLGQLSRALLVHPTTVTTAVDQLEREGLVNRVNHPTDRRAVLARLTDAGLARLDAATKDLAEANFGFPGLSDAKAEKLIAELREVRSTLGDVG